MRASTGVRLPGVGVAGMALKAESCPVGVCRFGDAADTGSCVLLGLSKVDGVCWPLLEALFTVEVLAAT